MSPENHKKKSRPLKRKFNQHIDLIANIYHKEFKKYGYSLKSLMWPKGAQDARFKVKFDIGNLNNTRILDVGCGFGHMLDYLKAWGISAQYTGIEICSDLIEIARKRHPDADFRILNILNTHIEERWDWVFSVGALNVATDKNLWSYVQAMINRMFDLCAQGVAIDFLSTYVDFQKENAFHASPEKVFSFAKKLTQRVALRHDYMAYEFTVYLYKRQELTKNNIFKDFKKNIPPEPEI